MTNEEGSALFEVLVLGVFGALLILTATVAAGSLQAAGEEATEVAQSAAAWGARYGDAAAAEAMARDLLPDARVTVSSDGHRIEVTVRSSVALIGPEGGALSTTVTGRATAAISPYRSRDG